MPQEGQIRTLQSHVIIYTGMEAPQSASVVYSIPNAAYTCIMRLAARLLVALMRYCAMHAINVSQLAMLEHVYIQMRADSAFVLCHGRASIGRAISIPGRN